MPGLSQRTQSGEKTGAGLSLAQGEELTFHATPGVAIRILTRHDLPKSLIERPIELFLGGFQHAELGDFSGNVQAQKPDKQHGCQTPAAQARRSRM